MLTISYSSRFKKDYAVVKKRGYNIALLEKALEILCAEQPMPQKYRDHALTGNFVGHRECHITPDWLLIYTCERLKIPTAFAVGQRKQVLPARVYGKFKCSPVYKIEADEPLLSLTRTGTHSDPF
jgi:mRNA interferase YafQ